MSSWISYNICYKASEITYPTQTSAMQPFKFVVTCEEALSQHTFWSVCIFRQTHWILGRSIHYGTPSPKSCSAHSARKPRQESIFCMCPASWRRHYNVTSSLIGGAHTQIDPCLRLLKPYGHSVSGNIGSGNGSSSIKCQAIHEWMVISYQLDSQE